MTGVQSPNLLGPKSSAVTEKIPVKAIASSKFDIDFVR
jgi:hypothetical protein